MNRASLYATVVALLHLLVTIVHGQSHRQLGITIGPQAKLFVLIVVLLSPLVAMALLWTRHRTWGLVLLATSMAGAFFFGFYHHFLISGPDNVGQVPATIWGMVFKTSSWLLIATEATGAFVGFRILWTETRSRL